VVIRTHVPRIAVRPCGAHLWEYLGRSKLPAVACVFQKNGIHARTKQNVSYTRAAGRTQAGGWMFPGSVRSLAVSAGVNWACSAPCQRSARLRDPRRRDGTEGRILFWYVCVRIFDPKLAGQRRQERSHIDKRRLDFTRSSPPSCSNRPQGQSPSRPAASPADSDAGDVGQIGRRLGGGALRPRNQRQGKSAILASRLTFEAAALKNPDSQGS